MSVRHGGRKFGRAIEVRKKPLKIIGNPDGGL